MELKRKGQSLKLVFFKYLISVGISLVVAIGLAFMLFNSFNYRGLIVPANYTENQILENKTKISNIEKFDDSLLPDNTTYVFLSLDEDVIQTDMSADIKNKAISFHNREIDSTPSLSFIEIERNDGYVIVNYSVQPYYTNAWMEKHFPKVEVLLSILLIVFSFINILLITVIWAKKLTKQLKPMLEASEKIKRQDLDFQIGKSNIKEFNDVLNGMEEMKNALSESLKRNWSEEENKRKQISALTHDLKTPISIVQGNAELLKDTNLTEEQESYLDFIIRNSNRISNYSKTLMLMNRSNTIETVNLEKFHVSDVVEIAREYAQEITLVHNCKLVENINIEDQFLMVDIDLFKRVIQNIVINAVDYSQKESTVELSILTNETTLKISVSDQGQGFTDEDLRCGTEQFYRGDKSRHSSINYGLGLYISSQIMELHKGKITLKNKSFEDEAVVTLEFPLI